MTGNASRARYLSAMGIDVYVRREVGDAGSEQPVTQAPIAQSTSADGAQPDGVRSDVVRDAAPSQAQAPVEEEASRSPEAPQVEASSAPAPAIAGDAKAVQGQVDAGRELEALAVQVSTCEACELCKTRTKTVFGVGNPGARVMVIGEGPGAEEDRRGEPFVGRAGKLLDSMLRAMGMPRESVYIANIVKCRPPNNRDPRPEEVVACSAYLSRQIELVAPEVIMAVGRVAAQNLLGSDMALGKMRASRHSYPPGAAPDSAIPVVVTYHPAYLLRSPQQKRQSWVDLKKVLALLNGALPDGRGA